MLNDSVIYNIFKNIAQRHDVNTYLRLNSFAVIFDYSEFNTPNFNKNKKDFDNGHYWTRSGVTNNDNAKDYGTLIVQKIQGSHKISNNEYCSTYNIGIAFPEMCAECPESYQLTKEQTSSHCESVLLSVVKECLLYKAYKIDIDGVNAIEWTNEITTDSSAIFIGDIESHIKDNEHNVFYDQLGVDNLHMASTRLTLCGCFNIQDSKFKETYISNEKTDGKIICKTCI